MPLSAVDVRFCDGQQNGTTVPPLSAFLCLASVSLSIARLFPTDRSKPFGLSNRALAESLSTGVRQYFHWWRIGAVPTTARQLTLLTSSSRRSVHRRGRRRSESH